MTMYAKIKPSKKLTSKSHLLQTKYWTIWWIQHENYFNF